MSNECVVHGLPDFLREYSACQDLPSTPTCCCGPFDILWAPQYILSMLWTNDIVHT